MAKAKNCYIATILIVIVFIFGKIIRIILCFFFRYYLKPTSNEQFSLIEL